MSRYSVKKCICHNMSFAAIKEYAENNGIDTIEELQQRQICSCGCRMCVPYVELVLKTGKTGFEPGAHYKKQK